MPNISGKSGFSVRLDHVSSCKEFLREGGGGGGRGHAPYSAPCAFDVWGEATQAYKPRGNIHGKRS